MWSEKHEKHTFYWGNSTFRNQALGCVRLFNFFLCDKKNANMLISGVTGTYGLMDSLLNNAETNVYLTIDCESWV